MPLFDAYVMVDWSAATVPVTGRDSIWIGAFARNRNGLDRTVLENPATRADATGRLCDLLAGFVERGRRVCWQGSISPSAILPEPAIFWTSGD